MYPTLQTFLRALQADGQLHEVDQTVSPLLEVTAIADRHARQQAARASESAAAFDPGHCHLGGKALLFKDIEGCDFPLAINVYGSYRRMEMALGCHESGGFEGIAARIAHLTKPVPPASISAAFEMLREFFPVLRAGPRRVGSGRCQEIVRLEREGAVDLTRLPLIKCWPLDGDPDVVGFGMTAEEAGTADGAGRYITFAGMHTIHADDRESKRPASHNIGMYRAQLIDKTRLAMHWHVHHDGAAHWRSWKKLGKPMPIAICLGGETVLPYAATCPLPPGISELLMAGFLNGRGIPMVPAKTVPLRVPANSEIVIEGYVSTECGEIGFDPRTGDDLGPGAVFEGPFGDHTGFYSLPDRYPIVDVTAVTHCRGAVYPTTIVGKPPQEDYYLGKATERVMLPLLKTVVHDIVDYHLPRFGCFHNAAFVQIRKDYPLQARRVMHAIWGAGQMSWTKCIIVVDEDVDVHDEAAVWRAVGERVHAVRDVELVRGPLDILDHAAPQLGAGHKIGLDATRRLPGEAAHGIAHDDPVCVTKYVSGQHRQSLRAAIDSFDVIDVKGIGDRVVVLALNKQAGGDGRALLDAIWKIDPCPDVCIVVDGAIDIERAERILFMVVSNVDPGRDIHESDRGHIGIDATAKMAGDERAGMPVRDYPPLLTMDDAILKRLESNAAAFGLSEVDPSAL